MTERAQKIMKAYEAEDTYNFPNDGVATAIRVVAERLYTDLGEMQHPSGVLEEIADEVDAL
jgi:hypothetical protein